MSDERVLLSWSSGKDCAWALHVLREQSRNVVGLLTTFNETNDRVNMHGVRREVVEAQADAVGVPLWSVNMPDPCTNEAYEARMREALERARKEGITHVAFGDIFLEDVRKYRERMLQDAGLEPIFPLWHPEGGSGALANEMQAHGARASIVCVDPKRLSPSFAGQPWDMRFLVERPADIDPLGENGEFHTVCWDGPAFMYPVFLAAGDIVERGGFEFADFRVADE